MVLNLYHEVSQILDANSGAILHFFKTQLVVNKYILSVFKNKGAMILSLYYKHDWILNHYRNVSLGMNIRLFLLL